MSVTRTRDLRARLPFFLLPLAAGLFAAARAPAQDYRPRTISGWTVSASSDGKGCFLTRQFEGPGDTALLLGLDTDGSNRLTVLNENWSIKEKAQLKLTFRLSTASFPRHLAVGIAADGKQGFVTAFGTEFPTTFASSEFLHITRGDVPVAELGLEGSGPAVAELRKCVALFREKPRAISGKDSSRRRIPLDPFAPDVERKPKE